MDETWLRRLVMLAIVLLVLHAVGAWAHAALGVGAAMAAAALVITISIVSGRMAGKGNDAWFVAPAVVFTAAPLAARSWTFLADDQSWWTRMVDFGPFVIGFAAPVLLLLTVYLALGRQRARTRVTAVDGQAAAALPASPVYGGAQTPAVPKAHAIQ